MTKKPPLVDTEAAVPPLTLAFDIGGTGLKAVVLDAAGKLVKDRVRIATPHKATPQKLLAALRELAGEQVPFDRISAGFPGVVKDGVVYTAPNLGHGWQGFDLAQALEKKLKRPARVANDADVQGMGAVTGHGLELVITLGTGFGSVIFMEGRPLHLELAHHPFHKGRTYEDELGRRALDKKGRKRWNKLLADAIDDLRQTFNFDHLYIGGGNAKFITLKLPPDVQIVSNEAGLLGGIVLWRDVQTVKVWPGGVARPAPERPRKKARKAELRTEQPDVPAPPEVDASVAVEATTRH
jgi:polyphosphate glucokinase